MYSLYIDYTSLYIHWSNLRSSQMTNGRVQLVQACLKDVYKLYRAFV